MFLRELNKFEKHQCDIPPREMYLKHTVWICPICHNGYRLTENHDNWGDPRLWKKMYAWRVRFMIWRATRGYSRVEDNHAS